MTWTYVTCCPFTISRSNTHPTLHLGDGTGHGASHTARYPNATRYAARPLDGPLLWLRAEWAGLCASSSSRATPAVATRRPGGGSRPRRGGPPAARGSPCALSRRAPRGGRAGPRTPRGRPPRPALRMPLRMPLLLPTPLLLLRMPLPSLALRRFSWPRCPSEFFPISLFPPPCCIFFSFTLSRVPARPQLSQK